MSQYIPQISSQSLEDKVVLITGTFSSDTIPICPLRAFDCLHFKTFLLTLSATGGANGIGASLVQQCLESGANVCFGDLDNISGERLLRKSVEEFKPGEAKYPARAVFQTTDVTNYQSVLALFDLAFNTYKRIDHVVSAAGISEIGNWFDFGLTFQTVRQVCVMIWESLNYPSPAFLDPFRRTRKMTISLINKDPDAQSPRR